MSEHLHTTDGGRVDMTMLLYVPLLKLIINAFHYSGILVVDENAQFNYFRRNAQYTIDRENFAVESNCENLTHKI